MKRLALVLSVFGLAAFLSVGTANAAVAPVTGSIDVVGSDLSYGDSVSFDTTVSGRLSPKGYVYVTVVCVQGSTVVYQWSADPSFTFPLVDQEGQGLEWNGQSADCSATLIYRIDGKRPTIQWLDQTRFDVTAS